MILAAGLLVLLGLGLFVAGVLTGVTAFYWSCVAACLVAAVLLFQARRKLSAQAGAPKTEPARTETPPSTPAGPPAATADGTVAPAAATAASTGAERSGHRADLDDPPVEEVEVTDLLMVVDLTDEVLVVDEHPRYHLAGCVHLTGRTTIPIPLDEARSDGFTPCAVCAPDRNLAERARRRRTTG